MIGCLPVQRPGSAVTTEPTRTVPRTLGGSHNHRRADDGRRRVRRHGAASRPGSWPSRGRACGSRRPPQSGRRSSRLRRRWRRSRSRPEARRRRRSAPSGTRTRESLRSTSPSTRTARLPCSAAPLMRGSAVLRGTAVAADDPADGSARAPTVDRQTQDQGGGKRCRASTVATPAVEIDGRAHGFLLRSASCPPWSYDVDRRHEDSIPCGLLTCVTAPTQPSHFPHGTEAETPKSRPDSAIVLSRSWPSRRRKRRRQGATSAARRMRSHSARAGLPELPAAETRRTACARTARRTGAARSSRSASRLPSRAGPVRPDGPSDVDTPGMIRVAVDALGGDRAPDEIVAGAAAAAASPRCSRSSSARRGIETQACP